MRYECRRCGGEINGNAETVMGDVDNRTHWHPECYMSVYIIFQAMLQNPSFCDEVAELYSQRMAAQ